MKDKSEYYKYIRDWKKENTEKKLLEMPKNLCILARCKSAIQNDMDTSVQAYMINAILQRLERDGFQYTCIIVYMYTDNGIV